MDYQALPGNYECGPASCALSSTSPVNPAASNRRRPVLGALNVHASVNARIESPLAPAATPLDKRIASGGRSENELTPESLAEDLEKFHLHSPERNANPSHKRLLSDKKVVNPATPRKKSESQRSADGLARQRSESKLATNLGIRHAIEKHEERDFEWVLSLPYSAGNLVEGSGEKKASRSCSVSDAADSASEDRQIHFGCNLLQHRARSGSDLAGQHRTISTYMLVATPLGANVQSGDQTVVATAQTAAASPRPSARAAAAMVDTFLTPERTAPVGNHTAGGKHQVSPLLLGDGLESSSADRSQSLTRSPASSVSRIEDTIEELDRLEDEFEAVHSLVRVDRVPLLDTPASSKPARVVARSESVKKPAATKPVSAVRADLKLKQAAGLSRTSSTRKPGPGPGPGPGPATTQAQKAAGTGTGAAASTANKRLSISRPTSLLPPKAPAKSSKPPTVSTFALPGEAVARRLKEQREKRLSAALAGPVARAVAMVQAPRKTRAVKPPTIPAFELPGEAISRRKREEHEAKLRQQEEEEKKRREFKAKPIRLSTGSGSHPRETVTSRARQNRMSMIGEGSSAAAGTAATGGPAVGGSKRLSVAATGSSGRTVQHQQAARGRGSSAEPLSVASQASRTGSASTGSINGLRSSVSMEDVQQQKLRGKGIYHRDNYLSVDRDQEKHEREAIAKQARQEAAERSRMLSREWAEKQRQRAKKLMAMASRESLA